MKYLATFHGNGGYPGEVKKALTMPNCGRRAKVKPNVDPLP